MHPRALATRPTRRPRAEPTARLSPANIQSDDTDLDQTRVRAAFWSTDIPRYPHHVRFTPVCTENLNPNVVVMKSAKDGVGFDASGPLNWARMPRNKLSFPSLDQQRC